ncbi:MAG TPA: hypothetical protein VGE74_19055 [Gemmata sp.]
MTEAEWLVSGDTEAMLTLAHCNDTRKRRLCGCACARGVLHFLNGGPFEDALLACESFADGAIPREQLIKLHTAVAVAKDQLPKNSESEEAAWAVYWASDYHRFTQLHRTVSRAQFAYRARRLEKVEMTRQAALVRDIFGNPFRPVTFEPVWRTDTAVALAKQMYDSRDFSPMPILADALQDAGCDSTDILDHCRGDGPHVRGCWVVDLVLGKE